jgi:hypothetical protein
MGKKIKIFDSNVLFSIAYTGKDKSRSYWSMRFRRLVSSWYTFRAGLRGGSFNIRRKKPDAEELLNELIDRSRY